MPDLTPERIREIEARCEAATKGPWEAPLKDLGKVESFKAIDFYFDHSFEAYPPLGESGPVFVANSKENAAFISSARTDIPDLLAALKQVTEERDALAACLNAAKGYVERDANTYRNAGWEEDEKEARQLLQVIADPAECLKARDAEIREETIREMGRRGGIKGAAALNAKLSPEERKASAQNAAQARWGTSHERT